MAFDPTATRSGSEYSTNPFYQGAWLCYINGIAVPIQGFSVTHGVWQIPNFTIDLIPDETLMRLGHEDLAQVALFYLDQWADPQRPEWRLLADGEIVGWSYRQTPGGRMMSFRCMSHIRTLQQLYFFYMTNVEDVVAAPDPSLRASGFATEGLSYPYALFHKGLRLTGAEATALNGANDDAATVTAANGDAIKAPFEFVYNVIRGVISKEVPDDKRSLPMMNFFARHIRTTRMHNRFVRQPLLEDASVLAARKGVFPIFEAARNEQALLAMQRHTASQLSNSGSVYSIIEQVLRLVYMELSMIPNPACVQVTLDPAEDGKIIAGISDRTPTEDIRASRPLTIPTAAQDTETTRRDREVARLAVQLGREPSSGDLAANGLAGRFNVGRGFENVDLGDPAEVLGHYRETLRRRGVQPAALLDELDPGIANQTRNIDSYDIAIARDVVRTGRLPQAAPEGGTGYSAGMLDHYRETVRQTGMTPQSLAGLDASSGTTSTAAQALTTLAVAVNQERERVINARRNAEAQAAREAEDTRQRMPYQEGVPPTAPLRLAQYAVKPQFLFGVPPACNVIYPSMEDGWTLDEDYTSQPTRIYVNDSAMTRLLRAQGANRDFMLHALTVAYPEEANAVMHHRIVGPNGMANSGAHETGKDMLIWPEEYFAGPKVARMALSPWFQTMMQWRNADAAGATAPAASPVTAPAQAPRAVNLQTAENVPRPHGRSYQNGRPDVFAQEWFGRARDRWNGEIGAEFRRQTPIFFDGGTAPQIFLGFSASAGQHENTRANVSHTLSAHFCAIGLLGIEQPEVGPVPYPTANPPPCPHGRPSPNTWFLHHDRELVKRALNGPAPLTEGSWRNLPPQIAIGLSNLHGKRRSVVNALRAAGVPPVGDNDPWTVIMMLMAWSTGPGGVAAHVRHFARSIANVSGERRWGALIRAAFEAAERGTVPARMPHNHRLNPYYSLIRGMQKVEVGRRLLQATGGNTAFLDDGLGADRQTVYDKIAHMAYVQQPEDASRRGRVSMAGTSGVVPPPPVGVSPAHGNDDPVTAPADARQTTAGQPTRTVTRPTGDAIRAATATPGVLNTTGQAIDASTVPREVVAAGLDPQDEFQKLFYLYAQYEFFRQRYEARVCGASLRFNPYILAGFPAVLFDTQKTGFHTAAYVQQVTHSASVGPMGSMQTTVQFIATRMLPEFFADVRRDSELFARRVDSAPAEMIPEIRDTLQVQEQAESYYQRLLYGHGEPPNGQPAAFDVKRAVGYQTESGDVEPIRIEETARIHAVNDHAASQPVGETVMRRDLDAAQAVVAEAQNQERIAQANHRRVITIYERSNGGRPSIFPSAAESLAFQDHIAAGAISTAATERVRTAQRNLAELQRRAAAQPSLDDEYNPPAVTAVETTVSHNINPNRELAPIPGVYSKAFEEYHTAMRLASRPVCTLNEYVRFWHGGESIGALLEDRAGRVAQVEGEVNTFAYASVTSRDVNTTGGPNGPASTQAVRNTATYYRRIYRLRQGPGPVPAPAERGYTDSPIGPSSTSAGVASNYPETRTDWDAVLLAYADKVRNIQFER